MKIYLHLLRTVKEELFNKIYILFLLLGVIFCNDFEVSPISQYSPNIPSTNNLPTFELASQS